MKQITNWDDLIGKTITGAEASLPGGDGILIMGDEYCVFCAEEDEGLTISVGPPDCHTLFRFGLIDEAEKARLEQLEKERKREWERTQHLAYLEWRWKQDENVCDSCGQEFVEREEEMRAWSTSLCSKCYTEEFLMEEENAERR